MSNTIGVAQTIQPERSSQYSCERPDILRSPKPECSHQRPSDLIVKPKKQTNKIINKTNNKRRVHPYRGKKQTQFIGLLQGEGSERSRIRVKVINEIIIKK